jgi:Tfp pilus assembly protein PilF
LEVKPADFNAWNKLLMVDSRMKAAQHQVDDASEALLYFPNVPSLCLALAYGYYDLEMYDEALTATVNGLDIALNSLDIMELWACKAAIYDKLGDYEQSDKCYEFALSQDEQDVTILNNYAYALADANRKLDYATTLIDKALISAPDNPYYLDTKAWIEYRKGNYEEAIKYLKKAISIDSNSSEYYEHLAEIYYAKGDLELARENIKIAIAKGCNNTELIDKILPKS